MSAVAAACAVGNAVVPGGGTAVERVAAGFAGATAVCENADAAPNTPSASAVTARRCAVVRRAEVEDVCGFIMASYLRRPPPPPPERDAPTLADPRWLLLRAAPL